MLWQGNSGAVFATIIAKATYALDRELCALLDDPEPIQDHDDHWDDDKQKSVHIPSDLVPFKAKPEVVVVGHAFGAGERPSHGVFVRVSVGSIDKVVEATSARRFDREGNIETGAPLGRLSLRYEVAPGGADSDNPVGIDATAIEAHGKRRLPQLVPPNHEPRNNEHVPFVGVGPVAPAWNARASLLRMEDRAWLADPLARPMPIGFDTRYFSSAPIDQRSDDPFRSDERLILEGLHPNHPRLVTNLAGIAPKLLIPGHQGKVPALIADTLLIDTDRQIVTLTFRAHLPVSEHMRIDLVADGYGEEGEQSAIQPVGQSAAADLAGESTMELGTRGAPRSVIDALETTSCELDNDAARRLALPFAQKGSGEQRSRTSQNDDNALPFRSRAPGEASDSEPPSAPGPTSPPPARPSLAGIAETALTPSGPPASIAQTLAAAGAALPALRPPTATPPAHAFQSPAAFAVTGPLPSPSHAGSNATPQTMASPLFAPLPAMAPPPPPSASRAAPPPSGLSVVSPPPLGAPPVAPTFSSPMGPPPLSSSGAPAAPPMSTPAMSMAMPAMSPPPMSASGTMGGPPLSSSMPGPPMPPAAVSMSSLSPAASPLSPGGSLASPPAIVRPTTVGEQRVGTALPAITADVVRAQQAKNDARPSDRPPGDNPFSSAFGRAEARGDVLRPSDKGQTIAHSSAKAASDSAAELEKAQAKAARESEVAPAVQRRVLVDLLSFEDALPRRLRRSRVHSALLKEFAPPRAFRRADDADAEREKEREDRSRLEVLRVLSCGAPIDGAGLHAALDAQLDDANDLEIPIFLAAGELKPTMDEIALLKATIRIAQPLANSDKRFQATLTVAAEAAKADTAPPAETVNALLRQIEGATRELSLPPRYFTEAVERSLLENRCYKKRVVLGQPRIRAEFALSTGTTMPIYLPESVGQHLPLLPSFTAVALVEVRPREDASESAADALVALALGRVVRTVRR